MKMYGNLTNRLLEGKQNVIAEIGMGATQLSYSDRDPYTIVEIISKNKIKVQADTAKNIGKDFYSQEWEITPNPNGIIKTLIQTKNGWKVVGSCTKFIIGKRDKYFDYEF